MKSAAFLLRFKTFCDTEYGSAVEAFRSIDSKKVRRVKEPDF